SKPVRAISLQVAGLAPIRISAEKRPSLAVLPFRGAPGDSAESYFTDGIVEDIVRGLGGLPELLVISRASTLQYSGAAVDARAVGAELGVRYVLQGTVRRHRGQLRIATELTDTETATLVHADRYEGDATDFFALQDRIATEVVAAIAPHVRQWELRRVL